MNPNQKITCISATGVTLSVVSLLIGIANLGLNIGLHYKVNDSSNVNIPNMNETNSTTTIINNNTHNNFKNITNIIVNKNEEGTFRNMTKPQCEVKSGHIVSKDIAMETCEDAHILGCREPYLTRGPQGSRMFAHGTGTDLRRRQALGTWHVGHAFRALIAWKMGQAPSPYNARVECIGWSNAYCHDGISRMSICVVGPKPIASILVWYRGRPVTQNPSCVWNILLTQESECVCHKGICPVVMTDGPANNRAATKIIYFKEGKIQKIEELKGSAQHIEECSCYGAAGIIKCICRDNWKGANRPVIIIDPEMMTHTSKYLCSKILTDTSRPNDPTNGNCDAPITGGSPDPGVKGFAFLDGENSWLGRTISKDSRSGYEMLKVPNAETDIQSGPTSYQIIVNNQNWSGYSGAFIDYWANKECFNPCFYVELIRGRPKESSVLWTSNSIVALCGSKERLGSWSWHDGAEIIYFK
ncbi:neuraminidase [Influenza A virus (A/duck/Eastern China/13/2010(H6N6))]|uniref:Neuraminidase n=1 Tax=Influenza A virus (A/duck/Eastern China/13/2010(H6N6)) TaxID=1033024 RepID=G8EVZ0_9INFA|nr:neuraminidase [Influenza A virus (A/duck/Eastern China/13/2010(H6N6))]